MAYGTPVFHEYHPLIFPIQVDMLRAGALVLINSDNIDMGVNQYEAIFNIDCAGARPDAYYFCWEWRP